MTISNSTYPLFFSQKLQEISHSNHPCANSSLVQFSKDGKSYLVTYEGVGGKRVTEFHMKQKSMMEVAGEILYFLGKKFTVSWSDLEKRLPNPSFLHIGPLGAKADVPQGGLNEEGCGIWYEVTKDQNFKPIIVQNDQECPENTFPTSTSEGELLCLWARIDSKSCPTTSTSNPETQDSDDISKTSKKKHRPERVHCIEGGWGVVGKVLALIDISLLSVGLGIGCYKKLKAD